MAEYVLDFGPSVSGTPSFTVFRNLNTGESLLGVAPALDPLTSGFVTFSWTSGIVVHFRAELSPYFIPGVLDQTDLQPATGEGSVEVNHNYGGTDNYIILELDSGAPVDDAFIYAYFADDFTAGRTERPTYVKGFAMTNVDGRWTNSMWLDPGDYTLLVLKQGKQTKTVNVTVA